MTTNSPHRPRKNTASSDHEKKNVTLDVPECYTGCSFDKGDDDAKSLFEEHPEDNPDENKTPKARDSWVETSYLDELPKTAPVPSTAASTVPQINITPEEFDSKTQTKSFFESIPEEEPFSWEDDTGLEGIKLERTPSKSNSSINARDRKKPILFRIYKWYQRRSLFLRTLLYILTGTAVLILPGLISLLFYTKNPQQQIKGLEMGELTWVDMEATGMKFLEYPYFAFSVYTCMIWIAWWGLRYVFRVLPEVLIRMADLVNAWTVNEPGFTEKFAFYVDYIRHLKTYLTILIWCIVAHELWKGTFTRANNVFEIENIGNPEDLFALLGRMEKLKMEFDAPPSAAVAPSLTTTAAAAAATAAASDTLKTALGSSGSLNATSATANPAVAPNPVKNATILFLESHQHNFKSSLSVHFYSEKLLSTFIFISMALLIEKFLLQLFAVYYQKRTFKDRVEKDSYAMYILEHLYASRKSKTSDAVTATAATTAPSGASMKLKQMTSQDLEKQGSFAIEVGVGGGAGANGVDGSKTHITHKLADALNEASKGIGNVLGAAIGIDVGLESSGVLLRTPQDAKRLARLLFEGLAISAESEFIYLSDFEPLFTSFDDAKTAFAFLDRDRNGDISKPEMKLRVMQIYKEHISLEKAIRHSSNSLSKLDNIFLGIMIFILTFLLLSVWGWDGHKHFTTTLSLWAAFAFAAAGSVKSIFESVVFLFITHPYDVNDLIVFDGESYIVKEFHLNTTVLTKHDGTEIYAPNASLASKLIHNIRRSGPQSEVIKLKLSSKTSALRIRRLQEAMKKYLVNEESREFFGKDFVIHLSEILDKEKYAVSMTLEHKRNFFDISRLKSRRNRFLWRLKREMDKLDIEHVG